MSSKIVLYHGSNKILTYFYFENQLSRWREKNSDVQVRILDCSSDALDHIVDQMHSTALFATKEALVIKRINELENEDLKLLGEGLKGTHKQCFLWNAGKLRKNLKFYRLIEEIGKVKEVKEPKKRGIRKWTQNIIQQNELKLGNKALSYFISRESADPVFLIKEIQKLTLLGKEKIALDDIKEYTSPNLEGEIWDLTDAIEKGDVSSMLRNYQILKESGVDSGFIFSMVVREFRLMYIVKSLQKDGKSKSEIAKESGLHPFVVFKLMKGNMELAEIKKLYNELTTIDSKVKRSEIDLNLALNMFFVENFK
jgi:DNA polymerase-3 subunit delta